MPYTQGSVHWLGSQRPDTLAPSEFVIDDANSDAYSLVCASIDRNQPLLIQGEVGVGKTTFLAEIDRRTRASSERHVRSRAWLEDPNWWTTASAYVEDVQNEYGYGKRFEDWGDWYSASGIARDCQRLFIDDLGVEKTSDDAVRILSDIIERRYACGRPTWFTTNLTQADIALRYGERTLSRILGRCTVVKMAGADRRLETAS